MRSRKRRLALNAGGTTRLREQLQIDIDYIMRTCETILFLANWRAEKNNRDETVAETDKMLGREDNLRAIGRILQYGRLLGGDPPQCSFLETWFKNRYPDCARATANIEDPMTIIEYVAFGPPKKQES